MTREPPAEVTFLGTGETRAGGIPAPLPLWPKKPKEAESAESVPYLMAEKAGNTL
jgi:hypothetical protein